MRTEVFIDAFADRRPRVRAAGGIAARQTGPDRLHLVSTAATPLGDDQISVVVHVHSGARLELASAAAMLVMPGRTGQTSTGSWHYTVDTDAALFVDMLPTIVAGVGRHRTLTTAMVAATAEFGLIERVQIGRSGESDGWWSGGLHVDLAGVPVLRHRIELVAAQSDSRWPSAQAMISRLQYPVVETLPVVSSTHAALRVPLGRNLDFVTAQAATLVAAQVGFDEVTG